MKIAIFGLARSGLAAMKFLSKNHNIELYVINQGEPLSWSNIDIIKEYVPMERCVAQDDALDLMATMDRIILSPGIARYHKALEAALKANVEVISEIELAFEYSDIPVIAITGTNGKTTTATMIAKVLEMAGKNVFLGGNIGRAYCEIFEQNDYDYAVIEVSSFQLESIKTFKPKIAMLLNITENHAERYNHIDDYAKAKYRLFENMDESDYVLIGNDLSIEKIKSTCLRIEDLDNFDFSKSKLVGSHNKKNFFCAHKVLELLNIINAKEVMQSFIDEFSGVDFRLQYMGTWNHLNFYNDAKSTNNAATRSAVLAFQQSDNDLFLVCGGKLRSDYVDLIDSIKDLKITKIFAIGEARFKLDENLSHAFKVDVFETLNQVFEFIKAENLKGNLVYSPAFPSFDHYANFEKRGEHFRQLVKDLLIN